ncbi:MAG TPA: winged helix-turn-helix domain-containing protein [Bryobacteraceae bacterium]|nr:winged helix-turn-helix domain-containing protein [Bryobacteraceae bacterium]
MPKILLRFGPFEADSQKRTLRRDGKVVALTPREFDTLLVLLEHPGEIVAKDVMVNQIWRGLAVSEGNLARQVKNLRQKLEPEGDLLIRNFPRQGYSIESVTVVQVDDPDASMADFQAVQDSSPKPFARKWVGASLATIVLGFLTVLLYPRALPVNPRILRSVQLTKDGTPKRGPVLLGGGRLWFEELIDGEWTVVSIPEAGGDAIPLKLPSKGVDLFDTTAEGGTLLLGLTDKGRRSIWAWQVSTGSSWSLGELSGDAAWAPDGHTLAAGVNNKLLVLGGDRLLGTSTISHDSRIANPRWTPDGRHVTFDLTEAKTGLISIWQSDQLGRNAEPIRSVVGSGQDQSHGRWTRDGLYLLYEAGSTENHDLWAAPNTNTRWPSSTPAVRLTHGPLNWTWPTPGITHKDIFALGEMIGAELVRFDRRTSTWPPYLKGISVFPAYELDFSSDGRWFAYIRYPEHTLWKATIDGSEQFQLTSAAFEAHQPHWSPDGKEIAYMAKWGDGRWRIFTVSSIGGPSVPLSSGLEGAEDQGVPTWSKDGKFIVYGDRLFGGSTAMKIHLFDRLTSHTSVLKGSDGLWTPRWSPNGNYISALRQDSTGLMVFGPGVSANWRQIVRGNAIDNSVWSRDSKYIYFTGRIDSDRLQVFRVRIPGGLVENIADIEAFPLPGEQWFGVAPDGSPLGIRSVRHQELYYLESTLR